MKKNYVPSDLMKIETQNKEFRPVVITLESQEEVDELFAILNNCKISKCIPNISQEWRLLDIFSSEKYMSVHRELCEITKD